MVVQATVEVPIDEVMDPEPVTVAARVVRPVGAAVIPAGARSAFSFARVRLPTYPTDSSATLFWNAPTALLVRAPKYPVGVVPERYPLEMRKVWRVVTSVPFAPR